MSAVHIEYLQIYQNSAVETNEIELLKFEQFARVDGNIREKLIDQSSGKIDCDGFY